MKLHDRLLSGFAAHFQVNPTLVCRAPGRVNLIGEHTDYNDGFALPIAIGAETQIAVGRATSDEIRVAALDFGETDSFLTSPSPAHCAEGGWRNYVRGVVTTLQNMGFTIAPANIAIAGSIEKGTGLSSSASLQVGLVTALLARSGISLSSKEIALIAQKAESDFVGVRCGNLDQLASAASREGAAVLIDCRSLDLCMVPFPEDHVVLIVQSGVARGLTDGKYNERRTQCEQAAQLLRVPALRDATLEQLEAHAHLMPEMAFRRARHVITENTRTVMAADAMERGDLPTLNRLMTESHASQRDDFGITVPQTDHLVSLLSEPCGVAAGARQTGGGFGGAVIAVLPLDIAGKIAGMIMQNYATPSGAAPHVQIETPKGGVEIY